jgi:hypothetical protein
MSVNETDDLTELRLWLVRLVSGSIALGLLVVLPYLWWLNVTPIDHVTRIDQREAILGVKDSFELRNQAIKSVTTSIQILANAIDMTDSGAHRLPNRPLLAIAVEQIHLANPQ